MVFPYLRFTKMTNSHGETDTKYREQAKIFESDWKSCLSVCSSTKKPKSSNAMVTVTNVPKPTYLQTPLSVGMAFELFLLSEPGRNYKILTLS